MALFKKKTAQTDEAPKKKAASMDIRIFAALMVIACGGVCALIVMGILNTQNIETQITEAKQSYQNNVLAANNLKALQNRSDIYLEQQQAYSEMLPETQNVREIMVYVEKLVEDHRCKLLELNFAEDAQNDGAESTSTGSSNEQHVQLKLSGNYDDVMRFMVDLSNSEEYLRIDDIQMQGLSESEVDVSLHFIKFSKR